MLVVFGYMGLFIYDNIPLIRELQIVSPGYLLLVLVLVVFHIAASGVVNGMVINALGKRISKKDEFFLAAVTRFSNYALPIKGGALYRARYLGVIARVGVHEFISVSTLIVLVSLIVAAIIGMLISPLVNANNLYVFAAYATLLLISVIMTLLSQRSLQLLFRLPLLRRFLQAFEYRLGVSFYIKLGLVIALQVILSAVMFFLNCRVLGFELSFIDALMISLAGVISFVVQITPAGLGILELASLLAAKIIHLDEVSAVASVLLGRVSVFLIAAILSFYAIPYLENRIISERSKDGEKNAPV